MILTAAFLLGVKNIYKCGGAQAIAAMAFGTDTIPKVHKIFGPGNAWVTEAKMQVASDANGAAIDLPAGPSEVLVIADEKASAAFVAADLLSQAEHDPSSQVILISTSTALIESVQKELFVQLETLPRKDIAKQALQSSRAIIARDLTTAMEISNSYAPEHLILQVENARKLAESVRHAGSVFIGAWTPESVGDYASGTNHVLPTYGFARAYSGVGLETFMKSISFQELSPLGLQTIGPSVECLARAEGLNAHERAVTLRLTALAKAGKTVMNLQSLIRPSILELAAYSSARSLSSTGEVFLDANESPLAPLLNTGLVWEQKLHRYPSPQPASLLANFARVYQVSPEQILMGRGSDEAIDLLTRSLCEPGQDSILITPPTYGMYKVSADIQNVKTLKAPLLQKDRLWSLDLITMKTQLTSAAPPKLVYICSPNNPTGTAFPIEDIRAVCEMTSDKSIIVLDEAYGEFAETQSGIPLLKEFKNLAILRTLSKSWGLAGLRCGVLLAAPELVSVLQKVRAPYPLPQPVIELATAATQAEGEKQMRERVKNILVEKTRLEKNLEKLQDVVKIYPSQANFLLVQFKDEKKVMAQAREKGIILRDRHSEIPNCVRITVGSASENDLLLTALQGKDLL